MWGTRVLGALTLLVLFSTQAFAQGTIFLVRHAERADTVGGAPPTMGSDPDLSDAGHARAASWAAVLKDAGIADIFVTEYKRTQQTAAPLAKALGLTPVTIAAKDVTALIARLKQTRGNALVVGHSNTVPEILEALGVPTPISIDDAEYDDLFIVPPGEPARVIRLNFR